MGNEARSLAQGVFPVCLSHDLTKQIKLGMNGNNGSTSCSPPQPGEGCEWCVQGLLSAVCRTGSGAGVKRRNCSPSCWVM